MPPEKFLQKSFSAGWTPSDSSLNGRPDGLLVMDNLDIDAHGETRMVYGTKKVGEGTDFGASVHTLFSKFINRSLIYYVATSDGKVYRDTVDIAAGGGSETRTAFGAAFNRVFICSGDWRVRDTGSSVSNLGLATPGAAPTVTSASGDLTGSYEYCQINVLSDGGYFAKSARGAISSITLSSASGRVTPRSPSVDEPQATEVWIFRRGGKLPYFYRVKRTSDYSSFDDNLSDIDTLADGVVLNENSVSINSATISEPILEMVGLVYGRMIYFTSCLIYFSEIASPDSVDPTQAMSHSGDDSEIFLWARLVGENIILVGTTKDLYILTGTFITAPDGYLDVSLRPLGVEARPLGRDAAVYNGSVIYFSTYGWRATSPVGSSQSLVIPNTDRLYRGENVGGSTPDYYGVPSWAQDTLRYSVVIAEERAWCRTPTLEGDPVDGEDTSNFRLEVFDLVKNYWHNRTLEPQLLYSTEEGSIIGIFKESSSYYLYFIDHFEGKKLDQGVTNTNQTIKLKTIFFDNGNPRNRKESTMLLLGIDTGNSECTIEAFKDGDQSTSISLGTVIADGWEAKLIDINSAVGKFKSLQIYISGALADFRLTYIGIEYDPFPDQVFRYLLHTYDFGEAGPLKKRIRSWPIMIDTLGADVTVTPKVDNSNLTAQTINTNGRLVEIIYIKTDAFGVDYGMVISGINPFELYKVFPPELVQILPVAKRFDQIGPIELARYGLIRRMEVRIITFGGTTIPYKIYVDDVSEVTGNLVVTDGDETVVEVPIAERTSVNEDGSIIRIELGPTSFDFHLIYVRIQSTKSGNSSDLKWSFLAGELMA